MPLLLRIHYQQQDYIFRVLTEKPSVQPTLAISLGGESYTFFRKDNHWILDPETKVTDEGLFMAIGKALALRFRISTSKYA